MRTLEELQGIFENDAFATGAGIQIDSVGEGEATCSVVLGPGHKNAAGTAMGGLVYTLADFTFAVAANAQLEEGASPVVTLGADIHYLRPAKEGRLTATAKTLKKGRRATVAQVDVCGEGGTMVAQATFTGM